jgi:hypothetical protein
LGDIERIYIETEENRATHLLVSSGLLSKKKKLIPRPWVDSVRDEKFRLVVEKVLIDNLPEFRDFS